MSPDDVIWGIVDDLNNRKKLNCPSVPIRRGSSRNCPNLTTTMLEVHPIGYYVYEHGGLFIIWTIKLFFYCLNRLLSPI